MTDSVVLSFHSLIRLSVKLKKTEIKIFKELQGSATFYHYSHKKNQQEQV